jgi:diguanylate cyclase (GGDEF)-like protein
VAYVRDHRQRLQLLGDVLRGEGLLPSLVLSDKQREMVTDFAKSSDGFRSITLLSADGQLLDAAPATTVSDDTLRALTATDSFRMLLTSSEWQLSGITASPFDGKPTLIMAQPLLDDGGSLGAVLLAELSVDQIEKLRRNIHFGKKGHSAIVDQHGRVIAHPNPEWMRSMKDLSDWPIVQQMMSGKTGVTEFYSSFIKKDMVAGFTSVPGVGWGIMVPQPKDEVAERVSAMLYQQMTWMLVGLLLAILLAFVLAHWITRPLQRLASTASALVAKDYMGELPAAEQRAPREVQELSRAVADLVNGLNSSYRQIDELNRGLQRRVAKATEELRVANSRLSTLAAQDHLTGLANRRHFESVLTKLLRGRRVTDGPLTLVLVDVDDFKEINDRYGHAAGDAVLVWMAELLKAVTRDADLLARYAGDEFVLCMACDTQQAREKADWLVQRIAERPCPWEGRSIPVTISVGVNELPGPGVTLDDWFPRVDQAMYRAKQAGRNQVAI